MEISRIPRKLKKELKKKYKHRYGINWLNCDNILVEYKWFFQNPCGYDMNKKIHKL